MAAMLRQNAGRGETGGPLPGIIPVISAALTSPASGEKVPVSQPRKLIPFVLLGGIAGSLLAIGIAAGWHLAHRKAPGTPAKNLAAEQVHTPAPPAEIAAPTVAPVDAPAPPSALPEEPPTAPARARRHRHVKAARAAKPTSDASAADLQAAELANLQNLAREAYAKGNYAEPRDASAIAYSQQALALDPSNEYTRTLLEDSIRGGKFQVQQAILSKDFPTAHRVADALAQLLPGQSVVANLQAEIAQAEKAEEESRRASQAPAPVLSFRAYHMHSRKGTGEKGLYCRGTLSVVAGHLKYVGETSLDGQVHNFDFACSAVEIKKNSRMAFWEKGFRVRTAAGNITFVPEDGSAAHLRDLAAACAK